MNYSCYTCERYRLIPNPNRLACAAYPDGIPQDFIKVHKSEGKMCNNSVGYQRMGKEYDSKIEAISSADDICALGDEIFLKRPRLLSSQRDKLKELCEKYGVSPYIFRRHIDDFTICKKKCKNLQ